MIGWKNGKFDFNCLEPQAVYSYLEDKGWKEEKKIDTRASILTTAKNDKKYSVLLPLETDLPDFASRMYDVILVLEVVENRPLSEIIKGLINVDKIAKEKQREILIVKFKSQDKPELPAPKMGNFLISLQKFFAAVSQTAITSENGRSRKGVLKKIELSVLETGDFGIKLGLPPHNDSSNDSEIPLAERVAATFLELVKSSGNSDKKCLKQGLLKLERKAVSSYRQLLVALKGLKADINVEWGSVNPHAGGGASLSKTDIQKAIKYVKFWQRQEHQIIAVKGKLLGANLSQNLVTIEEVETGKNYVAKFGEELLKEGKFDLTIGRLYSAKLEELSSINPATGTEKTQRTVIELAYIN